MTSADTTTAIPAERVAVVTGAASGIGAAVAQRLLAQGVTVVIADIDEEAATKFALEHDRAIARQVDVSDEESVNGLFKWVGEDFGGVDLVVNVAGVQRAGEIETMSLMDWDNQFGVNARGTFLMTKFAIPLLAGRSAPNIINVASAGGVRGFVGLSGYSASKAAIIAFTKCAAKELAPRGIRVNTVSPGWVDTPFNDPIMAEVGGRQELEQWVASAVPQQRQSTPDEMAGVVMFLASPESAYVTGHNLVADGGFTL